KERIGGTSYTASPVASDGRLYFVSEQGEVRVVKAGPAFELLAVNELGDYGLATPAISNGALFVRSQHYLWSLGKKGGRAPRRVGTAHRIANGGSCPPYEEPLNSNSQPRGALPSESPPRHRCRSRRIRRRGTRASDRSPVPASLRVQAPHPGLGAEMSR